MNPSSKSHKDVFSGIKSMLLHATNELEMAYLTTKALNAFDHSYGFEQQQRSSAQVASRSRNRTAQVAVAITLQSVNNKEASNANCE